MQGLCQGIPLRKTGAIGPQECRSAARLGVPTKRLYEPGYLARGPISSKRLSLRGRVSIPSNGVGANAPLRLR
jgi:hypothetical protein